MVKLEGNGHFFTQAYTSARINLYALLGKNKCGGCTCLMLRCGRDSNASVAWRFGSFSRTRHRNKTVEICCSGPCEFRQLRNLKIESLWRQHGTQTCRIDFGKSQKDIPDRYLSLRCGLWSAEIKHPMLRGRNHLWITCPGTTKPPWWNRASMDVPFVSMSTNGLSVGIKTL